MRIAFDLDDTLIPSVYDFPTEQPPRLLLGRLLANVPLRLGTTRLLRTLTGPGHELWIYTTSYRSPFQVRQLFNIPGIRICGVVNGDIHSRSVRQGCSKYPPAFGIDLLVDDSPGVMMEAERLGFRAILIRPDDENWVQAVLEAVES
jgi:hypothetical protein